METNKEILDKLCSLLKKQIKEDKIRPPQEYYDLLWVKYGVRRLVK